MQHNKIGSTKDLKTEWVEEIDASILKENLKEKKRKLPLFKFL